MATVFWDIKGVLLMDFLKRNHTVIGQHYSDQLEEQLHSSILSKRGGLLSKGIMLQHDNAQAHTANVTSSTITKLGWKVLVHPRTVQIWHQAIITCLDPSRITWVE